MKTKTTPEKPIYGSPCNGCGYCCLAETCAIGNLAFPDHGGVCPALVMDEGRFFCGIVLAEQAAGIEPKVYEALGIGRGCCSDDRTI